MKSTIIIIAGSIVLLGGLAWLGSRNSAADTAQPTVSGPTTLVASTSTYDFGSISMADGKVTYEYAFRNDGTEPVTLGKIYTSCMCTEAALRIGTERFGPWGMSGHGFISGVNETLAPGQEAALLVTFDPAAHGPAGVGPIQRTVTVENSAGDPMIVGFTANVTP